MDANNESVKSTMILLTNLFAFGFLSYVVAAVRVKWFSSQCIQFIK